MKKLTKQQLFDIVAAHLLIQNEQAMDEDGCAYRGKNDTKCAVGCLIPDDLYNIAMENNIVQNIITPYKLTYLEDEIDFLVSCQSIHDSVPVTDWRNSLLGLAEDYGCDTTIIAQFDGGKRDFKTSIVMEDLMD